MKVQSFLLAALLGFFVSSSLFAQSADDVLGVWKTQDGDAHVELYKCGDQYCGKLVWLDNANKKDTNNPDSKKKSRKLLGTTMMEGFTFSSSAKTWSGGTLYNSKDGKTYDGYMQLQDDGGLYMKGGYKVFGYIIGKENIWKRVK